MLFFLFQLSLLRISFLTNSSHTIPLLYAHSYTSRFGSSCLRNPFCFFLLSSVRRPSFPR